MICKQPTLLVDKNRVIQNIDRMVKKARQSQVQLRPHFKSHQSIEIGRWFRDFGIQAISVSSVEMAQYFANDGWSDICLAILFNPNQIDEINFLAGKIDLSLVVESTQMVEFLSRELQSYVEVWIKIDTGYHRTGIDGNDIEKIAEVAQAIEKAKKIKFKGLLTHAGHTYQAQSVSQIHKIYAETLFSLKNIRQILQSRGFNHVQLSIGDTPSCSLVERFQGVDEIRCGNFVFYDVMQLFIGSCREEDMALAVACPVISCHSDRHQWVVYGGAIHLSKDCVEDPRGRKVYGLVGLPKNSGFGPVLKNTFVTGLSQEHGMIRIQNPEANDIKVGDTVLIYPVHACLLPPLLRRYTALDNRIIESMNG